MKILTIGDTPCKALWDYFDQARLDGIDLILSSGDLPAEYLSFLVTFAHCPLLYVHGNHDDRYAVKPPEGCVSVEDALITYKGLRILGLGGSFLYNNGVNQYTEQQMLRRIRKLRFKIWRAGGVDLLLTHAPARGLHDQEDLAHRGFQAFYQILDRYEPSYMVHGHVHMNYGYKVPRLSQYHKTTVINSYERYVLEIE